ncbi:hypothetical protein DFJ74DRAFT_689119 [Hyaloraphidium curvatum]|nr:hypothetical protein DFJ74DRAFT_689119 [Hyaloraphidium curvatum]
MYSSEGRSSYSSSTSRSLYRGPGMPPALPPLSRVAAAVPLHVRHFAVRRPAPGCPHRASSRRRAAPPPHRNARAVTAVVSSGPGSRSGGRGSRFGRGGVGRALRPGSGPHRPGSPPAGDLTTHAFPNGFYCMKSVRMHLNVRIPRAAGGRPRKKELGAKSYCSLLPSWSGLRPSPATRSSLAGSGGGRACLRRWGTCPLARGSLALAGRSAAKLHGR